MKYTKSAEFYDLIYGDKDYASEVAKLSELIAAKKRAAGNRLLDVACGTGRHLALFEANFDCAGVDITPELAAIAQNRLPNVPIHTGDMRTFALDSQFDVITCLFSAIAYMTTHADLRQAIATMAKHLAPGGVMLVEPWLTEEGIKRGYVGHDFVASDTLKISRMNAGVIKGDLFEMPLHHLVGVANEVTHFVEIHLVNLFPVDVYVAAFEAANLNVEFDRDGLIGRGLYIATKPL